MRARHLLPFALLLPLTVGFFTPPEASLRGLWLKQGGADGEFRFYYFHSDGIGLYRYGRRHLNNTNSFDYSVKDGTLALKFRKTGETRTVAYELTRDGDAQYLTLVTDPREPGRTRYRRVDGPLAARPLAAPDHPFARMWIDQKPLTAGGLKFRIYQFQPPKADGRGDGWYHEGDYDDWSTETLQYRRSQGGLQLYFVERRDREATRMGETTEGDKRAIELMTDPRNFWHRGRFLDGGRSIMMVGGAPAFLEADP